MAQNCLWEQVEILDFFGEWKRERALLRRRKAESAMGGPICFSDRYRLCWFTLLVPIGRGKLAEFSGFG